MVVGCAKGVGEEVEIGGGRMIENCEHKTAVILTTKNDGNNEYAIERCTWGCAGVFMVRGKVGEYSTSTVEIPPLVVDYLTLIGEIEDGYLAALIKYEASLIEVA